jgi:hypothetical protein
MFDLTTAAIPPLFIGVIMKNRFLFALLAFLSFSCGLWAQESGRSFLKSIGLVYTISTTGETGDDKDKTINQSIGLTANLFIFPSGNLGYFINPGVGLRMNHVASSLKKMDMYFGAVFGPGFRIYDGSEVDILAGIGPDISCMVHLKDFENDKFKSTGTFLGLGLGGSLEARLKLNDAIAFSGGVLVKYNFAPYAGNRTFIASPYIGIGF